MFVMIIALLIFSLLGWPDLLLRIVSRIVFIPLIAGLSFELLRYAGRSDNALVKILSVPGLLLQKLTTRNPDISQLELAIAALKAVDVPPDTPVIEGFCGNDGNLLPKEEPPENIEEAEVVTETEVEVLPETEGEVLPENEAEVVTETEAEVLPGEVLPETEAEVLPETIRDKMVNGSDN
jgi:hypothetical protein